jgi:serine/threonine protein kinase
MQGNILVTDEGHATITDISVYTLASGQFPFHPSLQPHFVYQSPELLSAASDTCVVRTTAMDVYSFGLTTLAVS